MKGKKANIQVLQADRGRVHIRQQDAVEAHAGRAGAHTASEVGRPEHGRDLSSRQINEALLLRRPVRLPHELSRCGRIGAAEASQICVASQAAILAGPRGPQPRQLELERSV